MAAQPGIGAGDRLLAVTTLSFDILASVVYRAKKKLFTCIFNLNNVSNRYSTRFTCLVLLN